MDIDGTVITRYREQQESAKKGYNAKKSVRLSHHPLMAFIPELRIVANVWLRSRNPSDLNNAENFLDETLEVLRDKKEGLIRCDQGFYFSEVSSKNESQRIDLSGSYQVLSDD